MRLPRENKNQLNTARTEAINNTEKERYLCRMIVVVLKHTATWLAVTANLNNKRNWYDSSTFADYDIHQHNHWV